MEAFRRATALLPDTEAYRHGFDQTPTVVQIDKAFSLRTQLVGHVVTPAPGQRVQVRLTGVDGCFTVHDLPDGSGLHGISLGM